MLLEKSNHRAVSGAHAGAMPGLSRLEQLEIEGRWEELAAFWERSRPKSDDERLLQAKTLIYCGKENHDALCKPHGFSSSGLTLAGKLRLELLKAHLARRARNYRESEAHLHAAKRIGAKISGHPLLDEIQFQKAMNLMDRDQHYRALAIFTDLRKTAFSSYRRGLSALNECVILWDLGLCQKIQELLPVIPSEFCFRVQLAMDLANGNFSRVRTTLRELLKPNSKIQMSFRALPDSERENSLLHLVEWLLLEENAKQLHGLKQAFPDDFAKSNTLSRAFGSEQAKGISEPEACDLRILQFLNSGARGLPAYEKWIETYLKKNELFGPLLPRLRQIQEQSTPYANLWFRFLTRRAEEASTLTILVEAEGKIKLHTDKKQTILDFSRQPVSYRLLKNLKGQRGDKFSRKQIHEGLTASRYAPHLHDARLHKLLSRLGKKIEQLTGAAPWRQPGDRSLELLATIRSAACDKECA